MASRALPADADAARLRELGYEQELRRGLRIFDNVAMGFATISPVVGLYAVVLVGMTVAGPAWVWVLPLTLAGQCLLLCVYSELASQFPIANGAYQWSRRLLGPRYGWFNGWVALCAYAVANTTIAYLAAPWALTLLGHHAHRQRAGADGHGHRRGLLADRRLRDRRAQAGDQAGDRGRGPGVRRDRADPAARLPRAALLDPLGDARRRVALRRVDGRGVPRGHGGRRLGVHRLRRVRGHRRGDAGRGSPRAARGVDRAAERGRSRDPERVRRHARAPGPAGGRRRRGRGPGDDRGGELVRLLVDEAVRGGGAGRIPGLRHGCAGAHGALDLLGRARRRPARLGLPAPGRPAARPRAARWSPRRWLRAWACCSAWTRRRSAA